MDASVARTLLAVFLLMAMPLAAQADDGPAITPADLLAPTALPQAQYGMAVIAADDGARPTILTTGGEFVIDKQDDTITCRQRLARKRTVAVLQCPRGALADLSLTHQSNGAAIFTGGQTILRINGDSLLMLALADSGDVTARLEFTPDYYAEYRRNVNVFDPWGGISFFEHGLSTGYDAQLAEDPVMLSWSLPSQGILWAAVSPPKPYDWQRSLTERVVCRGSSVLRYMFPDDLTLHWLGNVSGFNVLYLHTENIWENWQTRWIPRAPEEYLRVMRSAQRAGMQTMVYASPKHFTLGTVVEDNATDDVDDPRSAGWHTGSNVPLALWQYKRLRERFDTPGFYLDDMYTNHRALAANYYVARKLRELVGDTAPLHFHCTDGTLADLPSPFGLPDCSTVHAYFSAIYKGEGVDFTRAIAEHPEYIRYNLGTHNISNTIAIPCFSPMPYPTPEELDYLIRHANIRMIMPEGGLYDATMSTLWWTHYLPRLETGLHAEIEPTLLQPTGAFAAQRAAAQP